MVRSMEEPGRGMAGYGVAGMAALSWAGGPWFGKAWTAKQCHAGMDATAREAPHEGKASKGKRPGKQRREAAP